MVQYQRLFEVRSGHPKTKKYADRRLKGLTAKRVISCAEGESVPNPCKPSQLAEPKSRAHKTVWANERAAYALGTSYSRLF